MQNNVHAFPLKKLRCAFPHVFQVGTPRGDDVDRAEDPLAAGRVGVFVVVIVVMVVVGVAVRVVCVTVRVGVIMA